MVVHSLLGCGALSSSRGASFLAKPCFTGSTTRLCSSILEYMQRPTVDSISLTPSRLNQGFCHVAPLPDKAAAPPTVMHSGVTWMPGYWLPNRAAAAAASSQSSVSTVNDVETVSLVSKLEQALGAPFKAEALVAPHDGLVVVISGPSGVGKDAVIRRLKKVRPSLHFVVTATSRSMRAGETHGRDYFFVSREEFESMISKNELLEHALVYGEYKGIPKQQIRAAVEKKTDVVLRLDVQGAATVKRLLGGAGVFIFLTADSELELVERLVRRKTEPLDRLIVRVATARQEISRLAEFDYVVVNRDGCLDQTVNTLCAIIDAEKARVERPLMKL